MLCIFCKCDASSGRKVEHIFPESLGGDDRSALPPGVVCDSCNQYFGSKIESVAIRDYPLNVLRLMNGVITKKRKWASLSHYQGILASAPMPRVIGFDPANEAIEDAILDGRITQMRMLAETRHPVELCRMLLKIGLEALAFEHVNNALDARYDDARRFSRAPASGSKWWFLYRGTHSSALERQTGAESMDVLITDLGGGEVAVIEMFDFSFFVPLTSNIVPNNLESLPEPEFRYFSVKQ